MSFRCIKNIEILMACDCIHGDLSAFNILYWQNQLILIGFPQTVDPFDNPSAFSLLTRDVERICQYFERYNIHESAVNIASNLWERYIKREL